MPTGQVHFVNASDFSGVNPGIVSGTLMQNAAAGARVPQSDRARQVGTWAPDNGEPRRS